jgi:hypothetical protein
LFAGIFCHLLARALPESAVENRGIGIRRSAFALRIFCVFLTVPDRIRRTTGLCNILSKMLLPGSAGKRKNQE